MIIRGATLDQIHAALADVNARFDTRIVPGYGSWVPEGRGFKSTIRVESSTDPFHRHSQRDGGCGQRMIAVCWHGHREFMRAIFRQAPDAIIRTSMAVYKGSEHFERVHRDTAWGHDPQRGIGSLFQPLGYSDACDCERGECPSRKPGRIAQLPEDFDHVNHVGSHLVSEPIHEDYGQDEADGAACRAMAAALRAAGR